jgi:hypothetical protein
MRTFMLTLCVVSTFLSLVAIAYCDTLTCANEKRKWGQCDRVPCGYPEADCSDLTAQNCFYAIARIMGPFQNEPNSKTEIAWDGEEVACYTQWTCRWDDILNSCVSTPNPSTIPTQNPRDVQCATAVD